MKRSSILKSGCAALVLTTGVGAPAAASETVTYTYDARGRLVKVVRSGSAQQNATVTTDYEHDRANNRKRVKTTGSPN